MGASPCEDQKAATRARSVRPWRRTTKAGLPARALLLLTGFAPAMELFSDES